MNTHLKQIKTSADSAQKCFADNRPSDALYHINGIQDRVQRMLQSSAATAEIHLPPFTLRRCPNGMLWLQRHEAAIWRDAHQFLLYEDFFLRRLGGEAVISVCLASRTQMMGLASGDWDDEILESCAIERARLARLAPAAGGVVGKLRPTLAAELGLVRDLLLVSGGHDQACAALGSGVIAPGLAMVSTGTAEVVEVAMDSPALAPALAEGGISVYRHVVPGLYVAMTLNHSGGLLLRWFRDTLGRWQVEQAAASGQDAYDLLLARDGHRV